MKSTVCKDCLNFSNLIYLSSHYLSVILFLRLQQNALFYCLLGFGTGSLLSTLSCLFVCFFFHEQQMYFRKTVFSRLFSWLLSCTECKMKTTQNDCLVQNSIQGQENCTESWL